MSVHQQKVGFAQGFPTTSMYDGDGLKRVEISSLGRTTLVWDGMTYLQERN